ncbi:hypothetical protein, partial [Synechococcus sp. CCY 9618]|uniref:hypothetical protein n=1 Tax=Synechococcus sp. CCY 9618 TaxID=2815602 RepID=UPI001C234F5D
MLASAAGDLFRSSTSIAATRSVALSSHRALSDSFAGRDPNATTSGSSAGSSCLCKDCTKLD